MNTNQALVLFLNSLTPDAIDDTMEYKLVKMMINLEWASDDMESFFNLNRSQRFVDDNLRLVIVPTEE